MKITKIHNNGTATAQLDGNTVVINTSLVDAKEGDFALIHAGCALELLSKDAAQEILDLFADLEVLANED
jgi:hydrogenase expression/formation protein HypC